jgi:hypothetical protein
MTDRQKKGSMLYHSQSQLIVWADSATRLKRSKVELVVQENLRYQN